MKVGDLVRLCPIMCYRAKEQTDAWGIGLVIKVHESQYDNHLPWVSVIWPRLNRRTKGPATKLEVISERG